MTARRRSRRLAGVVAGAALLLAGLALAAPLALDRAIGALGPPDLSRAHATSRLVVDRDGRLLRPFPTPDGVWRLAVSVGDVDPRFIAQLIAYEDRRFREHGGVDSFALLRAAGQWLVHGRIVSGGSTLTMQVARLIEPREERGVQAKLRQILRAIDLERRFGKDEILGLYLTLAPYGGNVEGLRAASLAYFGKEPRRLGLGESALLVALPQAPEARRPDRDPAAARVARERVLSRLERLGRIRTEDVLAAQRDPVPDRRRPFPMRAAHVAERLIEADPFSPAIRLTIDRRWQESLEAVLAERAAAVGPRLAAALLVVDVATGEVRAHVGSTGLLDRARAGGVDMALAVRSPGSALKPFVYGLAFEDGIAHPETLMEDRPVRFGFYRPENFDQGHMGTVTARQALQASLNVPVVDLLEVVQPARFLARLTEAGGAPVLPRHAGAPGLAVALGGLGIRLTDLADLYLGIARGGETLDLVWRADRPGETRERRRVLSPAAAWYVDDILRGTPAPDGGPSGRIAYKTGTSYGYRDGWAVGFDARHVVAVWVGRPDGASVPGLTGRSAAAPLLFDAFARIGTVSRDQAPPRAALIASTAELPANLRRFGAARRGAGPDEAPERRLKVSYPPPGARIDLAGEDRLMLKALGGVPPFVWFVDGVPVGPAGARRQLEWAGARPGFAEISVMDATGASDGVRVRLD